MGMIARRMGAVLAAAAAVVPAAAQSAGPQTVLFVGNSFTYGGHSAAWHYRADSVHDLNGDGVGGVPALFELFTEEAGLDYAVSIETSGGKTLKWHWENKAELLDRRWDHVVLQDLSTFQRKRPGDPAWLIDYAGRFARQFTAKNPDVDVSLTATWTRPDQTYLPKGHWYGKPVTQMALDLRRGYDAADAASEAIDRVNPVGQAFNCAILAGFADPNPYDGIAFDQLDLWAYDHYHASTAGYYLEALVVFAGITGKDPRTLGKDEKAADELGLSQRQAARLQEVAWATVEGKDCRALGGE
jgi:hypothetical protein